MTARNQRLSDGELKDLCDTLIAGGVRGTTRAVEVMIDNGRTQRSLYRDVLGASARRLGDMWDKDEVSFSSVHLAAFRIESIIRETSRCYTKAKIANGRRAIFATVPGDEHTIGLKMATELQRSKGWNIQHISRVTHDGLLSAVIASPAEILGLSIGSSLSMSKLYRLVRVIRAMRPGLKILVCGSLVAIDEDPFVQLGVDACASTLPQAERLLDRMAGEIASMS